jgi:hypothetical protein
MPSLKFCQIANRKEYENSIMPSDKRIEERKREKEKEKEKHTP